MQDPRNLKEELTKLHLVRTKKELFAFINRVFPGWYRALSTKYSERYENLNRGLVENGNLVGRKITHVMLTRDVENYGGKNHLLLSSVLDTLMTNGIVARGEQDWTICTGCKLLIPRREYHDRMREAGTVDFDWKFPCCFNRV